MAWSEQQGLFVATGNPGDDSVRVITSPDGVVWSAESTPWDSSTAFVNIPAYSPDLDMWVITGKKSGGDNLLTSPDGSAWTSLLASTTTQTYAVCWSDTLSGFVVSSASGQIMLSTDGVSFPTVGSTGFVNSYWLQEAEQTLFVFGNNVGLTRTIYQSDDAITWENNPTAPFNGSGSGYGAAYNHAKRRIVAVGDGAAVGLARVGTPVVSGPASPLWRPFVADLSGAGITDLSKVTFDRSVEVTLNAPLTAQGTVPSDNPQVWIPYDGDGYDDPYLAEGTRLVWWFRRESSAPPYYTVRAATLCQLVEDTAQQDDARTRFVGWDPWHYLMSRPVCNADGVLPGIDGLSYTDTQASVIIAQLLRNTIDNMGHAYVDAGVTYSGTAEYSGTLETGAGMIIDINFAQGTSVGQAWKQVVDLGVCDIILDPIYDPMNRPNYLCELNVYAQAGVTRDEQIFAWNLPGRNLVGINRQEDGTQRANSVFFRAGQGGAWGDGTIFTDGASASKYGEYWAQQFFPGVTGRNAVDVVNFLAQQQLELRANGQETVTFSPAPERSPRPWLDFQLGDRVPVWASATKFRKLLGDTMVGSDAETQYQRIYGWRANISDDALETLDPVLVSPQGFTG